MPSPKEQTAQMPEAAGQGVAESSALAAAQESPTEPQPSRTDVTGGEQERSNRAATASFVAGILGFTGVGIIAGIGLGILGLTRPAAPERQGALLDRNRGVAGVGCRARLRGTECRQGGRSWVHGLQADRT